MFHRIIVSNYIYSFDKKKYEHVISKIIKGKIYTHYIDTKRDIGIENQLYYKYLSYKNHIYLKKNYDGNKTKQNCIILKNDDNINEDEINRIISKIKVDSDYSLVKEQITKKDSNIKMKATRIDLLEDIILNRNMSMDNYIESLERENLKENFISDRKQRFFLLPFIGSKNEQMIQTSVMLTIYDIGIIHIQVIVGYDIEEIPKIDVGELHLQLDDIKLYKIKQKYKNILDYFDTYKETNIKTSYIKNYYKELVESVCKIKLYSENDYNSTINFIGDYEEDKNAENLNHIIEKDRNKIISLLNNSSESLIKAEQDEKVDQYLKERIVFNKKDIRLYIDNISSLILWSNYRVLPIIISNLKNSKLDISKENIQFKQSEQMYYSLFQIIKYVELTEIKKFYAKNLLNKLITKDNLSYEFLAQMQEDLHLLKIGFDADLIFRWEGSQKELFKISEERNNTVNLINKSEKLLKSICEDLKIKDEDRKYKNEKSIVYFTSLLSVIVSFEGIKEISYNILANLGIVFINEHPLRVTIILWVIFNILICYFIWRPRLHRNKKQIKII